MTLTVGIAQYRPEPGDPARNLEEALGHIAELAARGAELVVLPEMWTIGYDWARYRELTRAHAESVPGPTTAALAAAAREHGVLLAAGSIAERDGDRYYNTALLFSPAGELLATHRKVHLYSAADEHEILSPGEGFTVVETGIGKVGLCVCYDGDFPETARLLALAGADLVVQVNAYESPCEPWWERFYPAHAMTNAVWWVLANMAGDYGEVHLFGGSRIISPRGEIVAAAPTVARSEKAEPAYLVQEIRLEEELEAARAELGGLLRDRRPDLYGPLSSGGRPGAALEISSHAP